MPYAPQRRHAVGIMSSTTQALNLIEHLYQPNLLILVSRMLAQMQIAAAGLVHPTMLLHLLDYMGGIGKGVMLDFVGQARPASLTRMLLLDLLIFVLQIHSISISYLNNKSAVSATAIPELPYADMLLPVTDVAEEIAPEDFDIESGLRRRKGKARAEEDEDEVIWLDETEGDEGNIRPSERDRLLNQSSPPTKRSREPPRIVSISLSHLLNLLLHLPTPIQPSPVLTGATPAVSPGATNSALPDTGTTDQNETVYSASDGEEDEEERLQEEEIERRSIVRAREGEAEGAEDRSGQAGPRMPGDYWVRGRGNGG